MGGEERAITFRKGAARGRGRRKLKRKRTSLAGIKSFANFTSDGKGLSDSEWKEKGVQPDKRIGGGSHLSAGRGRGIKTG